MENLLYMPQLAQNHDVKILLKLCGQTLDCWFAERPSQQQAKLINVDFEGKHLCDQDILGVRC